MLLHLALGFALGALSSLVPGPCGLAVMTAAANRGLTRTLAIAAGGGLGDGTYATLGLLGVAPLVAHHPLVPAFLQAASGLALVGFGLTRLLTRPAPARDASAVLAAPTTVAARRDDTRELVTGLVVGLGTVIANPGALLSWAALVGAVLIGASAIDATATCVGIAAGSAAWLAILGTIARARRSSRRSLLRRISIAVALLLTVSGVVAFARAAHLLAHAHP